MSNDDTWSSADKIPPMVYVPPPDADAQGGRGGVIGLIVLLVTIIAIVVAAFFSLQNWVISKSLTDPSNWTGLKLDGGVYRLMKNDETITLDADAGSLERFEDALRAQNREMCLRPVSLPRDDLGNRQNIPELERQVDDSRRSYDTECSNAGRSANCPRIQRRISADDVTREEATAFTEAARLALCEEYLPRPQGVR